MKIFNYRVNGKEGAEQIKMLVVPICGCSDTLDVQLADVTDVTLGYVHCHQFFWPPAKRFVVVYK